MGAYGWPAPTIGQCLNGEYGWLEVNLRRRPLDTSQRAMIAADLATVARDGHHNDFPDALTRQCSTDERITDQG